MNEKTIVFKARSKKDALIQPKPIPAAQVLPKWWKDMTPYNKSPMNPDGKKALLFDGIVDATFKKCTPLLDGLTSGYIVSLWSDVLVTQDNGVPYINWKSKTDVFQLHGPVTKHMDPPIGYDNIVFKYMNTWIPQTPKGYSTIVTTPFGHRGLPFYAVPAVIDTDNHKLDVTFPMWIRSKFEGLVDAGTPLVQLIPFKRDNWKAEFDFYEDGEYDLLEEQTFNKTIFSHYIKNTWSKKSYK